MQFRDEKIVDEVTQREFSVEANGEEVPCAIWAPEGAEGTRPLILMGHGGSQHKKILGLRNRAKQYAKEFGWATLSIDAPGHGDRITREEARKLTEEVNARVTGNPNGPAMDPSRAKVMAERSQRAVPEWQAALDVALGFDFIDNTDQIGYWGLSMGTAIGVPLLAVESRIKCAVLGLAGLRDEAREFREAANRITIPIQFVFQWEDAVATRDNGLALFDAFASETKTMHINPGGHLETPAFEGDAWKAFFSRYLVDTD